MPRRGLVSAGRRASAVDARLAVVMISGTFGTFGTSGTSGTPGHLSAEAQRTANNQKTFSFKET